MQSICHASGGQRLRASHFEGRAGRQAGMEGVVPGWTKWEPGAFQMPGSKYAVGSAFYGWAGRQDNILPAWALSELTFHPGPS